MIKIRLSGTRDELAEALPVLRDAYNVLSESKIYKDREPSQYYRLYVDVEIKPIPLPENLPQETNHTGRRRQIKNADRPREVE